jgi:SPP1 gp7 family putative phage head morphogenesis protein
MQLDWQTQQQISPPPQYQQYQQSYEGPPSQEAIKYAQTRGAQIAAKYGLTPNSANRLAQIVSDGIKNKRGIPGLARDIRKEFPDISKSQSELIAQTETASALSKASHDRMQDMGIDGKEWVACPDSCAICRANAAVGVIPVNQMFPGGVMQPPQHEGCRCALAPARLGK